MLAGGTLAPGNSAGTLTTSDLLLDNAAILSFELGDPADPAASDHVRVIGDLTLDGILMVIPLTGFIHLPLVPSEYVLFDYDNLAADLDVVLPSRRFTLYTTTGIGEGAGQVILQYIPEPTSGLLLGLLVAVGLRRRR